MLNHRQICFQLLNNLASKMNKAESHFLKQFNPDIYEYENVKIYYRLACKKIKDIKYDLNRHDLAYAKNADKFLMYASDKYRLANPEISDFNYFVKCFLKNTNKNKELSTCQLILSGYVLITFLIVYRFLCTAA